MMALIYATAQRPEDLVNLTPRAIRTIDHKGAQVRVLRIRQLKTGVNLDIVITPDLGVLLGGCMGKVPNLDRPFIARRNGKEFTYDGLSAMFRRYVKKCKLSDFGLYDLRGKAATDLYRAGTPKERIQQLLGHESVTTTEIYLKARMPSVVMPNERAVGIIPAPNPQKKAQTAPK
jgi:integrase